MVKTILLCIIIDAWLYWLHRAYHSRLLPRWFRNIHRAHHDRYLENGSFSMSLVEFGFSIFLPFFATSYLLSPWVFPLIVAWGWFEASRGHGKNWWFKWIPASFYRRLWYCGYRYHHYHHAKDESKNLGQFLKIWDKICKTERQT